METMMILNIYEETASQPDPLTIRMQLPFSFVLEVHFPSSGYPGSRLPSFHVCGGPNVALSMEYEAELARQVSESITCGQDSVALQVIPMAIALAEEYQEKHAKAAEVAAKKAAAALAAVEEEEDADDVDNFIPFILSAPVLDRKSKFIAHCAAVSSMEDVHEVIDTLRSKKQIAIATHPTIWAFRYRDDEGGFIVSDMDDDGEQGASSRLMFLLEQLKLEGWIVVVTRYFGGILLGPDRYKHIMSVAREVLMKARQYDDEEEGMIAAADSKQLKSIKR